MERIPWKVGDRRVAHVRHLRQISPAAGQPLLTGLIRAALGIPAARAPCVTGAPPRCEDFYPTGVVALRAYLGFGVCRPVVLVRSLLVRSLVFMNLADSRSHRNTLRALIRGRLSQSMYPPEQLQKFGLIGSNPPDEGRCEKKIAASGGIPVSGSVDWQLPSALPRALCGLTHHATAADHSGLLARDVAPPVITVDVLRHSDWAVA